jgi:primosomal protein N''
MLYAISVPIDIMSTSSFRSKMRVIKAANEKNYNFTRLLYNTSNQIIVFILQNINDEALSFLKTRLEKNILRNTVHYLAKPFAIF